MHLLTQELALHHRRVRIELDAGEAVLILEIFLQLQLRRSVSDAKIVLLGDAVD